MELRVSAEHTEDFIATDHSSDLLAALDSVIHKVERQLRKHKEKLKGHKVTGLKHHESFLESDSEESVRADED